MKQLSVIGNLVSDCKRSANNAIWFTMAIDNGKSGNTKNPPLFVNVYGAPEVLEKFLVKGLLVYVSGPFNIKLSHYTDQSGIERASIDLMIYQPNIQLLKSPND